MFFSLLVKVKPNFPQLIVRKEPKTVALGGMASSDVAGSVDVSQMYLI